jgi:hypothetical protein
MPFANGLALIRWSAEQLASKSKLGVATIPRADATDGEPSITLANAAAIQSTLEAAGVQFIPENGGGASVRLAKRLAPTIDQGKRPEDLDASNDD